MSAPIPITSETELMPMCWLYGTFRSLPTQPVWIHARGVPVWFVPTHYLPDQPTEPTQVP